MSDNKVLQSGTVTPGHVAVWTTDGVVQDGGTSAGSSLTSLGITSAGDTPFAINDASVGPYSAFSLGINPTNGALISVNSFGGAPLLGLNFRINGNLSNLSINPDGSASLGAAGPFLPLIGGNLTGPLSLNGSTYTWAGTTFTNATGQTGIGVFTTNQLHVGSSTTNPSANSWSINDRIALGVNGQSRALSLLLNFGGGSASGGKAGLNVTFVQTGPMTDAGITQYYVAGVVQAFGRFPQPGSSATLPLGDLVGMNITAALQAGFTATNWVGVNAAELSAGISAGSSAQKRTVLNLNDLVGTSQGTAVDNMIWFYGIGQPWRYGLNFGDHQEWPIDASIGTMFGANIGSESYVDRPFQTKWGIDLQQVIFPSTGNSYDGGLLRGNGITIDGIGRTCIGTTSLTPSATGLAIDANSSVGTGVSIATPGTGYATGSGTDTAAVTALGGVWMLTTDSSGVPTSARALVQPVFPSTTPPANPITPTALNKTLQGSGLTLNITWNTTATALSLQPSGGTVQVGSGCIAANGSVATVLGSVGPVGSHTTVQEWFAIKNASGVTRYIAAF